jgi:hypothetical protein
MQAYQGYFEDGQFIAQDHSRIPEHRRAIVTVLDDPIDSTNRVAAWDKFFEEIDGCGEEVPEFERIKLREVEI